MNMYVKKKAIAADENLAPLAEPSAWDSRAATNIMEMPMKRDPHIIVGRRPMRSSAREGIRDPSGNMSWMQPAIICARRCSRPTFSWRTALGAQGDQQAVPLQNEECDEKIKVPAE